jgi:hypothetical protein
MMKHLARWVEIQIAASHGLPKRAADNDRYSPTRPLGTPLNNYVCVIGTRQTSMGAATYIIVRNLDASPMSWREVYDRFSECFPDKWAVQFFPPKGRLRDAANWYHLYVLDTPPEGVDICTRSPKEPK